MFPKKAGPPKKPAMEVKITAGKTKPPMDDDMEAPDPIEGKPMSAHEDEETPDQEGAEEYGAKVMADIDAAGESMGMDSATARKAAGMFLKAIGDCLTGGGQASGEGDMDDMGGMGDMGAGNYGR